jgi:hypothetical protein
MNTYEEQKAIIAKFNVIDDVFFQKMVEDIGVAEEIIRIILQKPKLNVIKCETQRFLRNIGAHSVVLDLVCEDEDHSIIHVEVQKKDDGLMFSKETRRFTILTGLSRKQALLWIMVFMRYM